MDIDRTRVRLRGCRPGCATAGGKKRCGIGRHVRARSRGAHPLGAGLFCAGPPLTSGRVAANSPRGASAERYDRVGKRSWIVLPDQTRRKSNLPIPGWLTEGQTRFSQSSTVQSRQVTPHATGGLVKLCA